MNNTNKNYSMLSKPRLIPSASNKFVKKINLILENKYCKSEMNVKEEKNKPSKDFTLMLIFVKKSILLN